MLAEKNSKAEKNRNCGAGPDVEFSTQDRTQKFHLSHLASITGDIERSSQTFWGAIACMFLPAVWHIAIGEPEPIVDRVIDRPIKRKRVHFARSAGFGGNSSTAPALGLAA